MMSTNAVRRIHLRAADSCANAGSQLQWSQAAPTHAPTAAIVFIDTETTGLPGYRGAAYTESDVWPRIVSLAWVIADGDVGIRAHGYSLIKPVGFTIPPAATHIHHITTPFARQHGRQLREVLIELLDHLERHAVTMAVAHNVDFDIPIVAAEFHRLRLPAWIARLPAYCTMKNTTDLLQLDRCRSSYKWPKLAELYLHLFGRPHQDAHHALSDVAATLECYCELSALGLVQSATPLARPSNFEVLRCHAPTQ